MATIIPFVPGEPEQKIEITLDQETVVMRARYNSLDDDGAGAWYLDVWEADGETPIAFGIKLILGTRLGETVDHPVFAAGMFLLPGKNATGAAGDPKLNDLGVNVDLVHLTAADAVLLETTPL